MNNEPRRVVSSATDSGLNQYLAKMYGFMAAAVGVSALTAYLITTMFYIQTMTFLAQHRSAVWIMFGLQLVIAFMFKANRSPVVNAVGLFGFAILEGVVFSTLVAVYTMGDITMAFVSAATLFVVLAVMGTVTKRDLSGVGRHAMAALIALIIVSIINFFLQSPMINYIFSYVGIIIFAALVAFDSQRFKQSYYQLQGQVNMTSLALMGAFQLYLDFVNLFLQLLNIFGGGSRD